ncbi:hypothetical protein E4U60_000356, partial [Claviceps pazoutovae]
DAADFAWGAAVSRGALPIARRTLLVSHGALLVTVTRVSDSSHLRRANDSGEASLSGGEPTTPKVANRSEGRIFEEVDYSGGANHVEDPGVQCLQVE